MRVLMKLFIFVLLFFSASSIHAESMMNCKDGGSASLGDLKFQVRSACGEPLQTEVVGYIDRPQGNERIRVMKIEEWIYSSSYYGQAYFYSLVFEGNKLVEIKKARNK